MKRIISLCCVALICVFSLATPVRADDLTSLDSNIQLLDYTTANNSGSNFVSFTGSTVVSFDVPYSGDYNYIDILIKCSGALPSAFYGSYSTDDFQALNFVAVHDGFYRVYGTIGQAYFDTLYIKMESVNSAESSWYDFASVKLGYTGYLSQTLEGYCDIVSTDYNGTIHYVSTDEVNYRTFSTTADFDDLDFNLYIHTEDWYKYDYIDFQFYLMVNSVTSISAVYGDTNIPFEVSYVEPSNLEGNAYYVTIRIDVSGLERTTADYPMIILMGRLEYEKYNLISFMNCSGLLVNDINPIYLYISNVIDAINTGFDYVGMWISNQSNAIGGWIQEQNDLIDSNFLTLRNNMQSWIQSQTDAIGRWFQEQNTLIDGHFLTLQNNLQSWIQSQTDAIVSAVRGDTSSGNQFQQDVQQELNELDEAQAVMDSVTKPAVEDIDVSVDKYVSQADIDVLAAPMAVFFQGEIFSKIIVMSIILATVSYVLYGKR